MIPPRSACKDEQEWLECCRMNFAAAALTGICGDGIPGSHHRPEATAREAYAYADAMLEQRQKEEP